MKKDEHLLENPILSSSAFQYTHAHKRRPWLSHYSLFVIPVAIDVCMQICTVLVHKHNPSPNDIWRWIPVRNSTLPGTATAERFIKSPAVSVVLGHNWPDRFNCQVYCASYVATSIVPAAFGCQVLQKGNWKFDSGFEPRAIFLNFFVAKIIEKKQRAACDSKLNGRRDTFEQQHGLIVVKIKVKGKCKLFNISRTRVSVGLEVKWINWKPSRTQRKFAKPVQIKQWTTEQMNILIFTNYNNWTINNPGMCKLLLW